MCARTEPRDDARSRRGSSSDRAVNESVIIAFMLLFALNSIITAIYFQIVPQNGM